MENISVLPVRTKSDEKRFIRFLWDILCERSAVGSAVNDGQGKVNRQEKKIHSMHTPIWNFFLLSVTAKWSGASVPL